MILTMKMGISFIDDEAARYSLVKYSSPSPCMRAMIYGLSLLDAVHPFGAWHERVPSPSNPADLPSRGEIQKAIAMFGAEPLGDIVLPDSLRLSVLILLFLNTRRKVMDLKRTCWLRVLIMGLCIWVKW